jgi:hypothetical protein
MFENIDTVLKRDSLIERDQTTLDETPNSKMSLWQRWFGKGASERELDSKSSSDDITIDFEPTPTNDNSRDNSAPRYYAKNDSSIHTDQYATLKKRTKKRIAKSENSEESKLYIGRKKQTKRNPLTDLSNDASAEALGRQLFKALCPRNSVEITPKQFEKYFKDRCQAQEVFALFDRDGNGTVLEEELIWAVRRIYKEKRDLKNSMGDLSQALGNLNTILTILSLTLGVIVSLPLFGLDFTSIVPFTSVLLALSFVFGGSARVAFDCIIFLFVIHPYDTGDRIFLDDGNFVVEEINLLTTTLEIDGKKYYVPNGNNFFLE